MAERGDQRLMLDFATEAEMRAFMRPALAEYEKRTGRETRIDVWQPWDGGKVSQGWVVKAKTESGQWVRIL